MLSIHLAHRSTAIFSAAIRLSPKQRRSFSSTNLHHLFHLPPRKPSTPADVNPPPVSIRPPATGGEVARDHLDRPIAKKAEVCGSGSLPGKEPRRPGGNSPPARPFVMRTSAAA
ncbi:hypothetical protein HPP92_028855 [Vanilla planifolia]|uniref:Uncharacterized protein n=1 Tax=Vanilla planifolia TaxID=51239 RepID=A0A835P4J0_VANPL|nr:hypothetical protein HPP92_028855 [Vanilla planifolia]KAG0446404.1 hypothetical protein HPP92_028844 [Vanilla planifolia]